MLLRIFFSGLLSLVLSRSVAQRSYAPASVLAQGSWYKIAVKDPGIYRIDISFLNSLGINGSSIPSGSIRLFGNGGQMLSEANNTIPVDDLYENAIQVVDGGDGTLNGPDYILFYAAGPQQWVKDSVNQRFSYRKNLYSDRSFYFLSVGGTGKRITEAPVVPGPGITVSGFSERYAYELDTINFLQSGKEWYGEEFANAPGRTLQRTFPVRFANIIPASALSVRVSAMARSTGAGSSFALQVNGNTLGQLAIAPIGSGQYEPFGKEASSLFSLPAPAADLTIGLTYQPGSFNAQGWLNRLELFGRRSLSMNGVNQLPFRDWNSVGPGSVGTFAVSNSNAATQVWDITDPLNPVRMPGTLTGSEYRFTNQCHRLREYIAFGNEGWLVPQPIGRVINQNLHQTTPADYLLIVHPPFLAQAQRLAALHQQRDGLRTVVATTEQVYNEFAGGSSDPVAIRDFVKMYYDRYATTGSGAPKYLLLLGDASYDYKDRLTNNTNLVPAYESSFTLDPLATYTSDDFYGFLEDDEDINSTALINDLDIGIGRVPARSVEEAKNFVDKVQAYLAPQSLGPWRNNLTFVADDEDDNLHLQDAETVTATAAATNAVFNQQKIYLDAYRQESGAGGSIYPQANQAVSNQFFNGTLIWNYNGHGGPRRLADETIIDQSIINGWSNASKLPLFITATCDFAPYDIPSLHSIGENILVRPKTGAIALMTTTRVVFAFSNRIMNDNYLRFALQPDANGKYLSLGETVRQAKNYTYQNSGDITNNRKFTLLGDPALTLAFPKWKARPVRINGRDVAQPDTLSAGEKVLIEGEVTDAQGNLLSSFNGNLYPVVFDKAKTITTLANDPGSQAVPFTSWSSILFKGRASVTNGRFSFSFKVPRDINYQYGNGRLSLYAENGSNDGNGVFNGFFVGGMGSGIDNDRQGPAIKAYLNDENFVDGGLTNTSPVLLLRLSDSSGINTSGTGIGHDIVATLDNDNSKYFVLNDFYQGELDDYQTGQVRFQLPELTPGPHTLHIKAWDIANNSGEASLNFTVANNEQLQISRVLNYPNPFTTRTQFWFEHNKPGQDLQVRVQVFTVSGRIIKMIQRTINTPGNRSFDLEWDGRDEFGDRVGRGVYIYKLSVTAPGGFKREKIEKIVVL